MDEQPRKRARLVSLDRDPEDATKNLPMFGLDGQSESRPEDTMDDRIESPEPVQDVDIIEDVRNEDSEEKIDLTPDEVKQVDGYGSTDAKHDEQAAPDEQLTDEERAGITVYVNPDTPGFSGILKQRYSDFLVNEILPSGEVLHLRDLSPNSSKGGSDANDGSTSATAESEKIKIGEASSAKEELAIAINEEPASSIQNEATSIVVDDASSTIKDETPSVVQDELSSTVKNEPSSAIQDGQPTGDGGNATNGTESAEPSAVLPEPGLKTHNNSIETPQIADEDKKTLASFFGDSVGRIISLYGDVLKYSSRKPREFKNVASTPIADKQQRTAAHQAIRRIFKGHLDSETADNDSIHVKKAPLPVQGGRSRNTWNNPHGRSKGRVGWNDLGGEYLHFTLCKENRDTMESVSFLARQLKLAPKNFQFAGTKDRRAVTVQRISVFRVFPHKLANTGKELRGAKVGDFKFCPRGLELGHLQGNEFVITLRDCSFTGDTGLDAQAKLELGQKVVNAAVEDFKKIGFINYYGLQRFGSFSARTDQIGMKLLQGDLEGAIDLILDFSPQALAAAQGPESDDKISRDDKARAEALHIWKTTHQISVALDKLPRKFSAESSIINHLGQRDRKTGDRPRLNDFQGALSQITRNLRLMYVHAYQSLVWNVVAGKRWQTYGDKVVAGDMVMMKDFAAKDGGDTKMEEVDEQGEVIVQPGVDDRAADAKDAYERARPLTKEEAESGKFSIYDVVLPLPGFDVQYPPNEIGDFYKTFMASERGGGLDPYDMRRKWRDISLSGGYRKFLAKPSRDMSAEVKLYTGDVEQLVETDLDRLQKDKAKSQNGASPQQEDPDEGGVALPQKVAVILKLQLGTSQYATVALREMMKAGGVKTYKPDFGGGR